MKASLLLLVLALVSLALPLGCSSDDETRPDSSGPVADLTFEQDQALAVDQSPTLDQQSVDFGPISNSGKICTTKEECTIDDECILPPGSKGKQMCLSLCSPGKVCEVPNPVKNASQCSLYYQDPKTGVTTYYCIWFCLRQGKSYDCPNAEDYQCVEVLGLEKGTKICVPSS